MFDGEILLITRPYKTSEICFDMNLSQELQMYKGIFNIQCTVKPVLSRHPRDPSYCLFIEVFA